MSKTMTLDRVPLGETFTLDGVRFVKLAGDEEACFAVTESELLKGCPFEDEDSGRDDHNYFIGSAVQLRALKWLHDHDDFSGAVVTRPIDLTTMDGMTDYGKPIVSGRILTIDEYRKYRRFIPLVDEPYWLATGWTTASSPYSGTFSAYYINTVGTVYYNYVCSAGFAARPALYLQSKILVDRAYELMPDRAKKVIDAMGGMDAFAPPDSCFYSMLEFERTYGDMLRKNPVGLPGGTKALT